MKKKTINERDSSQNVSISVLTLILQYFNIFFRDISTFWRILINLVETIFLNSVALSLLSKQLIYYFVSYVL